MKMIKKLFLQLTQTLSLFKDKTKLIILTKNTIKENISAREQIEKLKKEIQKLRNENYAMQQRLHDLDIRALNKTYEGFKLTEIKKDTSLVWITSSDPELITENNFAQIRNVFKNIAPHVSAIATRHVDIKTFNKDQVKKIIEELNESIQKS